MNATATKQKRSRRAKGAVVSALVQGVSCTWIEDPETGSGAVSGDGTPGSRSLVARMHELWEDPIEVDHPSWKTPQMTTGDTPQGAIATFFHLGKGRAIITEAPQEVLDEVFIGPSAMEEEAEGQKEESTPQA